MNINRRKAYSEIYEILNLMEEEYTKKIPDKLRRLFQEEKDDTFKPYVNSMIPLDEQNLQEDTYTILAILYINYWYESEQEKQELIELFNNIDKQELEKYSVDNLFKNRQENKVVEEEHTEQSLAVIEESLWTKIKNKIIRLFKRNT